ncbi:MAG: acetyltransferase [Lachnospiraceae bacterium]|nr:acetyltransferase [Lachnospiraceae bacterium]
MERIIIIGKGGHACSLVDLLEREKKYEIAGYIVNETLGTADGKYPVIGNDNDLERIFQSGIRYVAIGIGYLGEPNKSAIREKLWMDLKQIGFSFPVICDPSAVVSHDACIGEGTFIGKGAVVNTNASIGRMCILNTGAIIEHGCQVGDFSHVSVGSVLCGDVSVGRSSFIGANATVIQGKTIGSDCVVGAGTVIRKNIKDGYMAWSRSDVIARDRLRKL